MTTPRIVRAAPVLSTFTFTPSDTLGMSLRALTREGEPWFNAADVCSALGIANVSQAVQRLDDDEKAMLNIGLRGSAPWFVSESGLYALILRSDKAEAKAFRKWVTREVLPTIRKQGAYVQGASNLSPEAQDALFASIRRLVAESLRRYDKETEHVHWRSTARRREWFRLSAEKVSREMGLPLGVVLAAGSHGIDAGMSVLTNER